MKLNRILYPTDYSHCSKIAFEYAVQLAHHFKVPLDVLHVCDDVPFMTRSGSAQNEIAEKENLTPQKQLQSFLNEYLPNTTLPVKDVNINKHIKEEGNVVDGILECAKETESSLIVLGTKGGGKSRSSFGTVAARLTSESSVPVLAIPEDNKFTGFKHLIFADDYEEVDQLELDYLLEIAEMNKTKLTVLHIREVKDREHQYRTNSFNRLQNMYADKPNVSFEFIDGGYNKLGSIIEYIEENEVDILALKKRNTEAMPEDTLIYQLVSKSVVPCLIY